MKTTSTWWKILLSGLLLAGTLVAYADAYQPSYSTAGFYQLSNTGRTVYNMNPAWRFYKGNIKGAEQPGFNDKDWNIVSLPDGIEYLPTEASGCINYQGEIWYRKHFTPEESWKGKQRKVAERAFRWFSACHRRCHFQSEVRRRQCNHCMGRQQ